VKVLVPVFDFTGAVKTMEGYAKLRPADANPLDSLGDVHYMYRKFPEAAAAYQQVAVKFPQFQAGGDYYKAAWAKFSRIFPSTTIRRKMLPLKTESPARCVIRSARKSWEIAKASTAVL